MSDPEEVPQLSAEAKAFLDGHAQTGEPSADALERGRLRLVSAPLEAAARPAKRRSTLFPPEVMAAAAVVTLLLGAQALYLVLRAPIAAEPVAEMTPVEPKAAENKPAEVIEPMNDGAELDAVAEAWRTGDFEGAARLASQACHSAGCAPLDAQLPKMLGLVQSIGALSAAQRDELAAFDEALTGSRDSALRRQLDALRPAPPLSAASKQAKRLFEEARTEKEAKHFERAALRLEKCIKLDPSWHPCYRMLGSVYASIAGRDQSALAMEKARRAYENFLEVAPPGDDYVPKVKVILEAARGYDAPPSSAAIPLTLSVDGTVKLPLPRAVSRLSVGDDNVIDAKMLDANTVKVEGMRRGKTTVMVWYVDGSRVTLEVEVKVSERRVERVGELFADANKALAAKDFVLVSAYSKQVLELEPGHRGAQNLLGELRIQARVAYLRGYQLREASPSEAITWFELAVMLTPAEDETHQKALSRIRELKK